MKHRIGILSPKEKFSENLIDAVNSLGDDRIEAVMCEVAELNTENSVNYRVIIDRISHCVDFYQPFLKKAALSGVYVINNPFLFPADDKFFQACLANKIGVNVPRTVCLPSKEYPRDVLSPEDLHNLCYPLDWKKIVEYIGFPAILKPFNGYGWTDVFKVNSFEELMKVYDATGEQVMILQEFINFQHYVRVFVIDDFTLPIKYIPETKTYVVDHKHLTPELGQRIVNDSLKLNKYLGYDVNTVEFAIKDNVSYAIDFMNPVFDANPDSITQEYFNVILEQFAKMAVRYAFNPVDKRIFNIYGLSGMSQ